MEKSIFLFVLLAVTATGVWPFVNVTPRRAIPRQKLFLALGRFQEPRYKYTTLWMNAAKENKNHCLPLEKISLGDIPKAGG
mmetsp:Transcript_8008/g.11678  ORF Transcript_8008/g.11678 Transcript_8008/m.11678 type:complete len:81 (+) Transcript_8008:70-312(+)